jgi:hypothetical protein
MHRAPPNHSVDTTTDEPGRPLADDQCSSGASVGSTPSQEPVVSLSTCRPRHPYDPNHGRATRAEWVADVIRAYEETRSIDKAAALLGITKIGVKWILLRSEYKNYPFHRHRSRVQVEHK